MSQKPSVFGVPPKTVRHSGVVDFDQNPADFGRFREVRGASLGAPV